MKKKIMDELHMAQMKGRREILVVGSLRRVSGGENKGITLNIN